MPKDKKPSPTSSRHSRTSPYSPVCHNDDNSKPKTVSPPPVSHEKEECEEIRCPICMEHPHNAVLLLCSSGDKGCKPYVCDTSSRHSNCLNQFCKSSNAHICPLCRGQINGWIVIEPVRKLLDSKPRNCSLENCDFAGDYSQLKNHAEVVHPDARPSEPNPTRESNWRNVESQFDYADLLSANRDEDEDYILPDRMDVRLDPVFDLPHNPSLDGLLEEVLVESEMRVTADLLADDLSLDGLLEEVLVESEMRVTADLLADDLSLEGLLEEVLFESEPRVPTNLSANSGSNRGNSLSLFVDSELETGDGIRDDIREWVESYNWHQFSPLSAEERSPDTSDGCSSVGSNSPFSDDRRR